MSFAEARNIQEQSRGQSSSALWLNLHKVKVTASNFHRVARCKDPQLMLPGLFNPPNLDHVPAIVHGRNHEKVAVAAYAKAKFQAGEPVVMKFVAKAGHFLSRTCSAIPAVVREITTGSPSTAIYRFTTCV